MNDRTELLNEYQQWRDTTIANGVDYSINAFLRDREATLNTARLDAAFEILDNDFDMAFKTADEARFLIARIRTALERTTT